MLENLMPVFPVWTCVMVMKEESFSCKKSSLNFKIPIPAPGFEALSLPRLMPVKVSALKPMFIVVHKWKQQHGAGRRLAGPGVEASVSPPPDKALLSTASVLHRSFLL
ncbi:hypothetical protein GN956_G20157 [Arapaima gigas]